MDEQLKGAFARALDLEADEISETDTPDTLPDWDSLAHLNLISELEKTFNIQISMEDVMQMDTFIKVRDVVNKYLEKVT